MYSYSTSLALLATLASTSSAHLILANPKPYNAANLDNSPLTTSNYPCKFSGSDASTFYSTSGISNTVAAGGSIAMSFKGSTVHGGGSCQVALSTDMQPSASTRWSTILSIEGGCPTKDGTSVSTYDVKIPSDVPAGDYSFAWTWISRLSGTQEYYMNCAPITVTGAKKARSEGNETLTEDASGELGMPESSVSLMKRAAAIDSIGPPLGVFNLENMNSCKSTLSTVPLYPDPGSNVESYDKEHEETDSKPTMITGSNCFAKGVGYSGSPGGGASGGSGAGGSGSGSPPATGAAPGPSGSYGLGSGAGAGAGSSPSGFATSLVQASATASSSTVPVATDSAGSSGSTGSAGSTGSTSAEACTTEGAYKCVSSTSYQRCASGAWSTAMDVSAGWTCSGSNLVAAKQRRSVSNVYLRGVAAARRFIE